MIPIFDVLSNSIKNVNPDPMANSRRQLIIGSLQPFLFCVGMYFVVLIFSVFICTSIYRTLNPRKFPTVSTETPKQATPLASNTVASL